MHVSVLVYLVVLVTVVAGATVQGTIGFGTNLVTVPIVALVVPEALPATLILLGLPLTVSMAVRERGHIDRRGVTWLTLGRIPGTLAGVWIVRSVASGTLSALVGGIVVAAVLMSVTAPPLRVSPATAATIGLVASTMGTASAIGGPPVALLYQHHQGPVLRSTLATTFVIGVSFSLTGLALAGQVAAWQVALAAALLPGVAIGLLLSRRLHGHVDGGRLRPLVLTFAGIAGVVALVRGVV